MGIARDTNNHLSKSITRITPLKICYSEGLFLILNNPKFERKYQILIIPLAKTKTKAKVKTMNTIDLSKCKIGQKLKRRNGEIVAFAGKSNNRFYPYKSNTGHYYTQQGAFCLSGSSPSDIIEILPLKKKAAKKAKSPDSSKLRRAIATLKASRDAISKQIKKLEELV